MHFAKFFLQFFLDEPWLNKAHLVHILAHIAEFYLESEKDISTLLIHEVKLRPSFLQKERAKTVKVKADFVYHHKEKKIPETPYFQHRAATDELLLKILYQDLENSTLFA